MEPTKGTGISSCLGGLRVDWRPGCPDLGARDAGTPALPEGLATEIVRRRRD